MFLSFSAVSTCVHVCERLSSKLSLLISSVIWRSPYLNSEEKYVKKKKEKNVCNCIFKLNLAQIRCLIENAAVLDKWGKCCDFLFVYLLFWHVNMLSLFFFSFCALILFLLVLLFVFLFSFLLVCVVVPTGFQRTEELLLLQICY